MTAANPSPGKPVEPEQDTKRFSVNNFIFEALKFYGMGDADSHTIANFLAKYLRKKSL